MKQFAKKFCVAVLALSLAVCAVTATSMSAYATPVKTIEIFKANDISGEGCLAENGDIMKTDEYAGWADNIVKQDGVAIGENVGGWWGIEGSNWANANNGIAHALFCKDVGFEGYAIFRVKSEEGKPFDKVKLLINARNCNEVASQTSVCTTEDGEYIDVFKPTQFDQNTNTGESGKDAPVDVTEYVQGTTEFFVKVSFPSPECRDWCALFSITGKVKYSETAASSSSSVESAESTGSADSTVSAESAASTESPASATSEASSSNGISTGGVIAIIAGVVVIAAVIVVVVVSKKKKN